MALVRGTNLFTHILTYVAYNFTEIHGNLHFTITFLITQLYELPGNYLIVHI